MSALELRKKVNADPIELSELQFLLAQSLGGLGEIERARELALAVRDVYRGAGDDAAIELNEVEAWLAAHPGDGEVVAVTPAQK